MLVSKIRTGAEFLNTQQVPLEHQLAFAQRLAWLRQIANAQYGTGVSDS